MYKLEKSMNLKSGTRAALEDKTLAMTYFHMRRPHTIIGADSFHF